MKRMEPQLNFAAPSMAQDPRNCHSEGVVLDQIRRTMTAYTTRDRPLVTVGYAQSLDGSIAALPGHPLLLSSSPSTTLTHLIRALHDGILVGIGTVLADDPRLTVRRVSGRSPRPLVLDSRLRFPLYARMLRQDLKPWIVATGNADEERQAELEKAGARVIRHSGGSKWAN